MRKRVVVAAVVAAALVLAGSPASAQSYPPPVRSITVDDATPAPGQSITVTLRTCKPGTFALIGVDLLLVATPTVGADGAAVATVEVPRFLRPGRHAVSGLCLAPNNRPLFLTTFITVTPAGGAASGGGGKGPTGSLAASGPSDPSAPLASPAGGQAGASGAAPSAAALDGPEVPADAAMLFEEAAASKGLAEGGPGAEAAAEPSGSGGDDGGPGLVPTLARVALGLAAVGGVPVALAVSRRPQRLVRRRSFA